MATQTAPANGTEALNIQENAIELHHRSPRASTALEGLPTQPPSNGISPTVPGRAIHLCPISIGYAFFCAGVNDGSLGPLIPYLLASYNISTSFISIVYGVTFAGWCIAALTNSFLMQYLDLGAMLLLGATLQLLAHILRVWHPPFALFAVSFLVASLGQAYEDTHGNTYVSGVRDVPHRWLGFIHALYMAGCLVGPLVATTVSAADVPSRWNLFYCFPLGLCLVNVVLVAWAFRDSVRLKRDSPIHAVGVTVRPEMVGEGRKRSSRNAFAEMKETVKMPSVWLLSLFFFFFLGAAITAGGTITS